MSSGCRDRSVGDGSGHGNIPNFKIEVMVSSEVVEIPLPFHPWDRLALPLPLEGYYIAKSVVQLCLSL